MSETLPLFDDLEPARAAGPTGSDRHLRAAWRLSRAMWRFPDHSPQQTRAGLAICEHLQALLAEAELQAPQPKSDPPERRADG